jgi:hypothetical protein
MTSSPERTTGEIAERIRNALAAWSELDASGFSDLFSEHVIFGSPSTEWIGDRGWTAGKSEVLRRFERERSNFTELELVDILVDGKRATILLRDGVRSVTCMLELDQEGRFSRLISFFVAPPGEMIALKACAEASRNSDSE